MNYNNIEDLSDKMLDDLAKKIEAEKTRRKKAAYDRLYNSLLDVLSEFVKKYPLTHAGNFGDYDLDWSDIYNMIKDN